MSGVRIQHPSKVSATFTITDGSRPYRQPLACSAQVLVRAELRPCGRIHAFKTYHFNLDAIGAAIVSPEIAELIRRIPGQPFAIVNEVAQPPDQVIRVPRLLVRPGLAIPGARHAEARPR